MVASICRGRGSEEGGVAKERGRGVTKVAEESDRGEGMGERGRGVAKERGRGVARERGRGVARERGRGVPKERKRRETDDKGEITYLDTQCQIAVMLKQIDGEYNRSSSKSGLHIQIGLRERLI